MVAGSKLYIQGGKIVVNESIWTQTDQLLSLDLAQDWHTSEPAWQSLTSGVANYLFVGVAATDNRTLLTFKDNGDVTLNVNIYDITSDKWTKELSLTVPPDIRQAMRAAVDPNTGLVYINSDQFMHVFDPRDNTIQVTRILGTLMPERKFAGVAYLKPHKKIIYMGGLNDEDGSTVVVYGGRIPQNDTASPPTNYTGTFYTLDVASGNWTQGPSTLPRLYMACVIIGDQFLAWGGFNGASTIQEPPIIYSLTQKQWVNDYKAPAYMKSLPTVTAGSGTKPSSTTPSPTDENPSSTNLGAILGGVFGGSFMLTLAGVIYLYLMRHEDRTKYDAVAKKKEEDAMRKGMTGDRDAPSRNPQKVWASLPIQTNSRDPQSMANDINSQKRVNGPQYYSQSIKGMTVIPQPVKTIYTSGVPAAATTASDLSEVPSSLLPTVFVNGSGFYSAPVSVSSTPPMYCDASDYSAQPVVSGTMANGIPVYMTSSGQFVALPGQPIHSLGAGYVMGYSGPAMSSSAPSSMVAGPPSSAHAFMSMPSSTISSTAFSSMSDSRDLGTSMVAGPPSSAYTVFSNMPPSTINSTAYSSMSDSRGLGASMEAHPPSLANTLSSVPSSTNSTAYSSMGSRNSTGYFPPPGSASKSEHSTGSDSTFVASSSYGTALTGPSSTNGAMASTANSTLP
ncbi:hypothetical protein CPB97_009945 [Podila verticillata]|nr:hypothetical protein CPB97_009945 [Podila verticillata]